MKKLLAVALVSASTGALGAGVLLAADGHALGVRPTISAATSGADDATGSDATDPSACDRRAERRHRLLQASMHTVAEAIGITPEELRAELADGGSIAEVASAHDVDPAAVEAALLDALEARIARLVESGRLDPERASQILDRAESRIHEVVTKDRRARPSEPTAAESV